MYKRISLIFLAILLCVPVKVLAQEDFKLQSILIDSILTKHANAVVRSENVEVHINNTNSVVVKTKRVVTVFNKYGERYANSYEWYDPSKKIKKIQAIVYNAFGKEIKKFKKKDFRDKSMYDGFSLIGDNRMLYFDHTPTGYPYTLVYESVVENASTAWIVPWSPISGYYLSIENSTYKVINPNKFPLRFNEKQFDDFPLEIKRGDQEVEYSLSKTAAIEPEQKSIAFKKIVPNVRIALQDFSLVDIKGSAIDWQSMGKWQYDNLVSGRDELDPATVAEISELVADARTTREKAKRIYEYVQNKTRYISVQLGIGGWMPMQAKDVDKLGYGDCKGLTNYTMALLDSQNITSYYTLVYGDSDKRDIDLEFASMEGNHAILNIPDGDKDIWLECTSQTAPFDFIGDFTDDRNVLVVTPEGGKIKRTKKYTSEENSLVTKATIYLQPDRSIVADMTSASKGLRYDARYLNALESVKDQKLYYKEYWDHINNLNILSVKQKDDKNTATYKENIKINASNYASKAGSRLLLIPNVFNRSDNSLLKDKDRKTPLVISRGYVDVDEYEIHIPEGYMVSSLPDKKNLTTEFGTYSYELLKSGEKLLKLKRELKINDGIYAKEKYKEYRKFMIEIMNIDGSKIVLKK